MKDSNFILGSVLFLVVALAAANLIGERSGVREGQGAGLERRTSCYAEAMGLAPWAVTIRFGVVDSTEPGWAAGTEAWPDYYEAEITYDTTVIAGRSDSGLRALVVHELAHVLLWELGEVAEAADEEAGLRLQEQTASRIDRMSVWLGVCR